MELVEENFYQPTPKEQQVWQVCDSLFAEKKRITYESIGNRLITLGFKRGSNTDIGRYLASWKKHHYPKTLVKRKKPPALSENTATTPDVYQLLHDLKLQQIEISQWMEKQHLEQKNDYHALLKDLTNCIHKYHERERHLLKALEWSRKVQHYLQYLLKQKKDNPTQ